MGRTEFLKQVPHPFHIVRQGDEPADYWDGAVSSDQLIFGTYIHGLFDHDGFRRQLINILRGCRGLSPLPVQRSRWQEKEDAYNRLADTVAASLDMEKLHAIMEERS